MVERNTPIHAGPGEPGGLEVPSSHLGAPINESPAKRAVTPQPSAHLEDERAEALRQMYEREREEQEARDLEPCETACTGNGYRLVYKPKSRLAPVLLRLCTTGG